MLLAKRSYMLLCCPARFRMSVTTSVLSAKCELFPQDMVPLASFTPMLPTLAKTNSFMLRVSMPSSTYVDMLRDGPGAAPAVTTQAASAPRATMLQHLKRFLMTNPPRGGWSHRPPVYEAVLGTSGNSWRCPVIDRARGCATLWG